MVRHLAAVRPLHYLLIGAALYMLDPFGQPGPQVPEATLRAGRAEIVITAAVRRRLREDWRRQHGHEPTAAQERGLVKHAIEEEILYRQALALGLDRDDRVIRGRLAQTASFAGEEGAEKDELVARARRLGLDRSDLVVRRYLVQMMRLVGSLPLAADLPTDGDVAAYFEQHGERFRQPERFHLTQIYLSRARHGPALEADALALLQRLRAAGTPPSQSRTLGDPFVRASEMRAVTRTDIERTFGSEFAAAVEALPVGRWSGPVASAYGLHLVWLHERVAGGLPAIGAVRNQVVHALLRERRQARFRERMRQWRARYRIHVAGGSGRVSG